MNLARSRRKGAVELIWAARFVGECEQAVKLSWPWRQWLSGAPVGSRRMQIDIHSEWRAAVRLQSGARRQTTGHNGEPGMWLATGVTRRVGGPVVTAAK